MPIQTNFALETGFFHVPIPATRAVVRKINTLWKRQPPRNGRIVARHTKQGMILEVKKPLVLVGVTDAYWRAIGRLVQRTGEPWWDLCAIVTDSEPQPKKPHAHALSLYRITAKGKLNYLVSEEPESLWPEAYASRPKTPRRPTAKLLRRVETGEEIAISRRGKIVAKLVPARPPSTKVNWVDSAASRLTQNEKPWSAEETLKLIHDASGNW